MNKIALMVLFLIGCAQASTPDVCPYTFSPGSYILNLDNTGVASEFCPLFQVGEIDFTNIDTFNASCNGLYTCSTDFFDTANECVEHHYKATGYSDFECSFTFVNDYELIGTCTDNLGAFICSYDALLDKVAPRQ